MSVLNWISANGEKAFCLGVALSVITVIGLFLIHDLLSDYIKRKK